MANRKTNTKTKNTIKRQVKKEVKSAVKKMSPTTKLIIALFLIVVVLGAGAYYYFFIYKKNNEQAAITGQFSVHFLELGNKYTGDCIYIKAGETDILVDGGSRADSISTITSYVNNYVTDGKIEYAIITHSDQDHIACFAGDGTNGNLFDRYKYGTIIDFPRTGKSEQTTQGNPTLYGKYKTNRDNEVANDGAVHYTALQCWNQTDGAKKEYTLADGITLQILYNYYYENNSSDENNYSVCFMINQGSNHYLFTGDLEKDGEKYLVQYNTLPQVTLFKAGHHGSGTSSTDTLLSVVRPQYIAITCVAGSTEYSHNKNNTFPYQTVCDRLANYTDNIFVTSCMDFQEDGNTLSNGAPSYTSYGEKRSLNGNIIFSCTDGEVSFTGSANNTKLKDSDWFKTYRTMPSAWAA